LSDFEEIQMYREIFGGELTYIGYPTNEGNGAMMNFSDLMGITENCSDKEAAWEFMRQFYMQKSDDEISNTWSFPVRKDDFDKFCANAMKDDEAGGTWGWGDFEIDIKPATQEDVDAVKDLINNTTAVNGAVTDDIMSIIEEDAASYFAGQKSAQDVAETIQGRIQIYLSETK
jgi:predicted transport protein